MSNGPLPPEGPRPNTPEAPRGPTPPPQESQAQIQAREAAAKASETAQAQGAEAALGNLAEGQTQGGPPGETQAQREARESRERISQTEEDSRRRVQEDDERRATQDAGVVGPGAGSRGTTGAGTQGAGQEGLANQLPQQDRENQTPQPPPAEAVSAGGGSQEPPKPPEAPPVEPVPEQPEPTPAIITAQTVNEGTPAAGTQNAGSQEAVPGPQETTVNASQQQPTEAQTGTPTQAELEAQAEERLIAALDRLTPEQLQRRIDSLDKNIQNLNRRLDRVTSLNDMEKLQTDLELLQDQKDLLEQVQDQKGGPPPVARRTRQATQEEQEQAQRRLNEKIEDVRKLSKMSVGDLTGELSSEQANIEQLKRMEIGPASDVEKDANRGQIRDSEARINAINDLMGKKAPEEQKATEEREAKTREEEARTRAEALEAARREAATPAELQTSVNSLKTDINSFKKRLEDLDRDIANTTDPDKLKDLRKQKADAEKQEIDTRSKLKLEQAALKAAEDVQRKEAGIKTTRSQDLIRKMTPEEFEQKSEEERANYLKEVGRNTKVPDAIRRAQIRTKFETGQDVSIEEMAIFTKDVSEALINRGRGGYNMENLVRISNQFPEIGKAIFENVTASREFRQQIRKDFPSNWERMIDFARNHPGWLTLILAILGGTASIATAGLASPLAGVAVAGAGGAGGAFGITRRNWG